MELNKYEYESVIFGYHRGRVFAENKKAARAILSQYQLPTCRLWKYGTKPWFDNTVGTGGMAYSPNLFEKISESDDFILYKTTRLWPRVLGGILMVAGIAIFAISISSAPIIGIPALLLLGAGGYCMLAGNTWIKIDKKNLTISLLTKIWPSFYTQKRTLDCHLAKSFKITQEYFFTHDYALYCLLAVFDEIEIVVTANSSKNDILQTGDDISSFLGIPLSADLRPNELMLGGKLRKKSRRPW